MRSFSGVCLWALNASVAFLRMEVISSGVWICLSRTTLPSTGEMVCIMVRIKLQISKLSEIQFNMIELNIGILQEYLIDPELCVRMLKILIPDFLLLWRRG